MKASDRKRIAEKLKRLWVLAERGATFGEREAARRQAENLERKHKLQVDRNAAINDAGFEDIEMQLMWIGPKSRRSYVRDALWREYLLATISPIFRTSSFLTRNPPHLDIPDTAYFLYLFGQEDAIAEIASFWPYVCMQIEQTVERIYERAIFGHGRDLDDVEIMSIAVGVAHKVAESITFRYGSEETQAFEFGTDDAKFGVRVVQQDHETKALVLVKEQYQEGRRGAGAGMHELEREDTPQPIIEWFHEGWRAGWQLAVTPPNQLEQTLAWLEVEEATAAALADNFGVTKVGDLISLRVSDVETVLDADQLTALTHKLEGLSLRMRPAWGTSE